MSSIVPVISMPVRNEQVIVFLGKQDNFAAVRELRRGADETLRVMRGQEIVAGMMCSQDSAAIWCVLWKRGFSSGDILHGGRVYVC